MNNKSMFSKRHYEVIAQTIKESEQENESKTQLIERIATLFRQDNSRFSTTRFFNAIYLHYHSMNGLHGCMPDSNTMYEFKQSALEDMRDNVKIARENGDKYTGSMKNMGYEQIDGNYYFSVEECKEIECLHNKENDV